VVAQSNDGRPIVFMMARAALTALCGRRPSRRPIGRRPYAFSISLDAAAAGPTHAHGGLAFSGGGWPAVGGRFAFGG